MSRWPAAVLFDFDGVIVNSEPLHLLGFQKVLAAEKIQLGEREYYQELIGFDDRGAFKHLYSKRDLPLEPKTLLRLMTRKSEMMMELIETQRYAPLPGVEEFVRGLWRHYPLAICSGALREEVEAMLEGIALRDCFPLIVAAEDVTIGKPDPQGYLLTMKHVAAKTGKPLKPEDCLIVEDAPNVIKSVRGVGFKTLGVATSHPLSELSESDWAVANLHPAEVAKVLPKLKIEI